MSSNSLSAQKLEKTFFVYDKPHHRLLQRISNRYSPKNVPVLTDINLEVKQGEIVGIVGRNGAGKTTLLKILSGITPPTSGVIKTRGRVGSILDLGFGFINELSGFDNIFFISALRGFTRTEVQPKIEAILDFCELGGAIYDPVLHYSAGMKMRLAYAISTHLDPDVLIIDEALAVGDEGFQHKCFQHLRELSDNGVSIIFVSHSSQVIQEFCDRALLLEGGQIADEGSPEHVIQSYHRLLFSSDSSNHGLHSTRSPAEEDSPSYDSSLVSEAKEYPSLGAKIHNISLQTSSGRKVNLLNARGNYVYSYQVTFDQPFSSVRFGMLIKSTTGFEIGGSETGQLRTSVMAGETLNISFPFSCHLNPGTYYLNAGVLSPINGNEAFLARTIDAIRFQVKPNDLHQTGMVDFGINPVVERSP